MCRSATITLTAANAVLTPTTSANVTPAGTMSTGNDSITGGVLTNGAFIQDASTTDTDVLSAVINAPSTPNLINVERIDATFVGGSALTVTNSTGLNEVRVDGANGQITSTVNQVASIPTVTLNSGYAGTMILDGNFANAANTQAVNVNGTATGAVLQIQDATNAPGALETLNMVVNSNSALTVQTNGADTITNVNITGAGVLTLGAAAAAQVTGMISASGMTGSLSATVGATNAALTGSAQADTFTMAAAAGAARQIIAGAGNDTFAFATFAAAANDQFNGGDGTDTVTLSSNLAHVMTNFSNIETITVNQGTTGATTLNLGNTVGTGTVTINASALTTATNTFSMGFGGTGIANAGAANTFAVNVTGGALADTIAGGLAADTITGGLGADHIRGAAGGDTIILTEATAAADIVYTLTSAETQALGNVAITAADIITGFAVTGTVDTMEVGNGAAGATAWVSAGSASATTASTFDGATDDIQAADWLAEALGTTALNAAGFNGVVVYEATGAVASSDFTTQAGINAAVTAITGAYAANAVVNTEMFIVVYDSQTTANAAVFRYSEGGADAGIAATELSLVGVLNGVGLGNLDHTNFI